MLSAGLTSTSVAQYALCLIHVGGALLLIFSLIITATPRSFWTGATQPALLHVVIPPHVQNLTLLPPELHKPSVDPVFTFLKDPRAESVSHGVPNSFSADFLSEHSVSSSKRKYCSAFHPYSICFI